MRSINFKITALFTIKTSKLNVKIQSSEVCHIAEIRVNYTLDQRSFGAGLK